MNALCGRWLALPKIETEKYVVVKFIWIFRFLKSEENEIKQRILWKFGNNRVGINNELTPFSSSSISRLVPG